VRRRILDLGVLELRQGGLVDEQREVVGLLVVFLRVEEADAFGQGRRLHFYLQYDLRIDPLGRLGGADQLGPFVSQGGR
jgi:hypothetical protein